MPRPGRARKDLVGDGAHMGPKDSSLLTVCCCCGGTRVGRRMAARAGGDAALELRRSVHRPQRHGWGSVHPRARHPSPSPRQHPRGACSPDTRTEEESVARPTLAVEPSADEACLTDTLSCAVSLGRLLRSRRTSSAPRRCGAGCWQASASSTWFRARWRSISRSTGCTRPASTSCCWRGVSARRWLRMSPLRNPRLQAHCKKRLAQGAHAAASLSHTRARDRERSAGRKWSSPPTAASIATRPTRTSRAPRPRARSSADALRQRRTVQ
eukprot:scaffold1073_cov383-Prasinococcus_capsulatus_cf.AAC.13